MKFTCSALALASILAVQTVAAQSSSDSLIEIVVTAQRRAERLQDVPAAITALSGDSLNELRLQGNADLAAHVPGLSFDVLGPGETTLTIRGLGTSYGLEPAVSLYVNETPLDIRTDGYAGAPDIDFFDVDRVEVLRGPQGTLYGSSSMGGAVRILTAQPDPGAFAVNAEVGGSSVSGGGEGYLAKSAVNLPLTANSAVRIVGTFEHVPGYINQAAPGDYGVAHPDLPVTARQINDVDLKSGRIMGVWKPTDALTIKPTFLISDVDASNNSDYVSNLPKFTKAATYPSPQASRLEVGNLEMDYHLDFATLMSSTSVLFPRRADTERFHTVQRESRLGIRHSFSTQLPGDGLRHLAQRRFRPGTAFDVSDRTSAALGRRRILQSLPPTLDGVDQQHCVRVGHRADHRSQSL